MLNSKNKTPLHCNTSCEQYSYCIKKVTETSGHSAVQILIVQKIMKISKFIPTLLFLLSADLS